MTSDTNPPTEDQPSPIDGATLESRERTAEWNEEGFQKIVDNLRTTLQDGRMLGCFLFHLMLDEKDRTKMNAAVFSYNAKDGNPGALLHGIHTVADNMLMPAAMAHAIRLSAATDEQEEADLPSDEPPSDEALEDAFDTPPASPQSH